MCVCVQKCVCVVLISYLFYDNLFFVFHNYCYKLFTHCNLTFFVCFIIVSICLQILVTVVTLIVICQQICKIILILFIMNGVQTVVACFCYYRFDYGLFREQNVDY